MTSLQQKIASELHVQSDLDPANAIREIVAFLCGYLLETGARGYVLGISGGQDSTLAGALGQQAVSLARTRADRELMFFAVRLPYGIQRDEEDALLALDFIQPDRVVTVDIQPAVLASVRAIELATGQVLGDFHRGNVKARERMVVQYALAGAFGLLVLGTEHAAESVTGFTTKHGDAACDVAPLVGLTKRQGRAMLQVLGAPARLYEKTPTADLEDNKPLVPDEVALGISYEQIDDYLEGKPVDRAVRDRVEALWKASGHKRRMPTTRFG